MALNAPKPSLPEGDQLAAKDILGHLLVIIPVEFVESIPTEFGDSPAVRSDIAVLTQDGQPVYHDVLWFNVALRNTLKQQIGEGVCARMGQGTKKPGRDAPFLLEEVSAEDFAYAEAWLAQNPQFEKDAMAKVSGRAGLAAPAQAQAKPIPAALPTTPSAPSAPAAIPAVVQVNPPVAAGAVDPNAILQALAALPPEERAKFLGQ